MGNQKRPDEFAHNSHTFRNVGPVFVKEAREILQAHTELIARFRSELERFPTIIPKPTYYKGRNGEMRMHSPPDTQRLDLSGGLGFPRALDATPSMRAKYALEDSLSLLMRDLRELFDDRGMGHELGQFPMSNFPISEIDGVIVAWDLDTIEGALESLIEHERRLKRILAIIEEGSGEDSPPPMKEFRPDRKLTAGSTFAVALNAARLKQGHAFKEAASELGVSPSTVKKWESGETKPHPKRADSVSKYLKAAGLAAQS